MDKTEENDPGETSAERGDERKTRYSGLRFDNHF
jgi:hypothetical protein